jgi:8-oxo-dGTP pyrophosphatase MutT (NUDIX family)
MRVDTTVRALLFDGSDRVLLQRVAIADMPEFFITPGGRVEATDKDLVAALRREIREETGLTEIKVPHGRPFFSGSHVLPPHRGGTHLTEHFFLVRLIEESPREVRGLGLTPDELVILQAQIWFSLDDLLTGNYIVLPVNLPLVVQALLQGDSPPQLDFSDPPQFRRRTDLT